MNYFRYYCKAVIRTESKDFLVTFKCSVTQFSTAYKVETSSLSFPKEIVLFLKVSSKT